MMFPGFDPQSIATDNVNRDFPANSDRALACGVERFALKNWLENLSDPKWRLNQWKLDTEGVLSGGENLEARGLVGHVRGGRATVCCG